MQKHDYQDSILLLDKPLNMSSAKVVSKAKWLFNFKKAGHTGSLDPLATGLLPICFGQATKFSQYLLNAEKTYYTEATLGVKTSTADSEGEAIQTLPVPTLTDAQLGDIVKRFTGEITQVPSMFSALKHNGVPLYQLARQGITVERKPRHIVIESLQIEHYEGNRLCLTVHCSKGTYIRNLVEDIGDYLGCGAHVSVLRRLRVGHYTLDQAVDLTQLAEAAPDARTDYLKPVNSILVNYPSIDLNAMDAKALSQGKVRSCDSVQFRALSQQTSMPCLVQLFDENHQFIGLGSIDETGQVSAKRMMASSN